MRIAHLITRFIQGGADENTLLSCNSFAENGHEVALIYGDEFSDGMLAKLHPQVQALSIPQMRRAINPFNDFLAFSALRRVLRQLNPDVVHTHTSKAGILGRAAAIGMRGTAVVHGIHILPFINVGRVERVIYLGLERALAPFTHKYVSVSAGMLDAAVANGVGHRDKHEIVLSGMELSRFTKLKYETRTSRTSSEARNCVLYLANYEPRKQHWDLIEAIASQRAQFADTDFIFAGKGAEQASLEKLVVKLGMSNTIKIVGFAEDPSSVIEKADVCIYCSSREGLPRAVVQYCAAGRPIVAFDLPGLTAIVRPGSNGMIYSQENFTGLLAGVRQILDDEELRLTMAANSRAVELGGWQTEHMYARLQCVYQSAIKETTSADADNNRAFRRVQ